MIINTLNLIENSNSNSTENSNSNSTENSTENSNSNSTENYNFLILKLKIKNFLKNKLKTEKLKNEKFDFLILDYNSIPSLFILKLVCLLMCSDVLLPVLMCTYLVLACSDVHLHVLMCIYMYCLPNQLNVLPN